MCTKKVKYFRELAKNTSKSGILSVTYTNSEPRREIFKYNDVEGMKRFKELTHKDILSKCFEEEEDTIKASEKWFKRDPF